MSWRVVISEPAQKDARRIPQREWRQIEATIDAMKANPFTGDVRKLGPGSYRRRVGTYRIFFEVFFTERLVQIVHIRRRTTTTYR